MVARFEIGLLPLCLCAQWKAGEMIVREGKKKNINKEGEVETDKVAGDHQGIDPAAPPLCTINRGTAGVDLRKKKEKG